jgi:hypothetical protein
MAFIECPRCGKKLVRYDAPHSCSGKSSGAGSLERGREVAKPGMDHQEARAVERSTVLATATNSAGDRPTSSESGVEGHAGQRPLKLDAPGFARAGRGEPLAIAGIKPGLSDSNSVAPTATRRAGDIGPAPVGSPPIKRGRPRIGEQRDKPWINLGMSQRTWYRRQAEKREKGK